MSTCRFCSVTSDQIWIEMEHAIAFADADPLADGHMVVAPRKHVSTIYELTMPEQNALWELVGEVRELLLTGLKPDGFSIGFDDVPEPKDRNRHAQVHVVPRMRGDQPNLPENLQWVTEDRFLAWKR